MRRAALVLALVVHGGGAAAAPVLHEPVQVPRLRCEDGICHRDGEGPKEGPGEGLPEALALEEGLVRAPSLRPTGSEQIYEPLAPGLPPAGGAAGPPPPGADPPPLRRLRTAPDRNTGTEPPGQRLYHEVFNPAVYPFKRMTVLDAVAEDETLAQRDPALRPLRAEGSRLRDGRDPFYGSVTVDVQPGRPVPVPSPAAGLRLLSFEVAPPLPLRFFRDGAEALYVVAEGTGRHRLVYLVDAPQRYFAGPLVPPVAARPRLRDVPPALRAPLPRKVLRHAVQVLRHLGLSPRPDDDYQMLLDRLVAYFRDFQMGELRERRGSTYLDIAFEQRGACRHRSYAFVITALGAGVPARYVENEPHVFAEVYVPLPPRGEGGYWRRVHLGGAPLEQRVLDAENKVAYRERGTDPFPQPPAFTGARPRQVEGLPPAQGGRGGPGTAGAGGGGAAGAGGGGPGRGGARAETKPPARPGTEETAAGGRGADGTVSVRDRPGGAARGPARPGGTGETGSSPPGPAGTPARPGEDDLAAPQDQRPDPPGRPLLPSAVTVAAAAGTERAVYRGALLQVRGRVQVRGGSAAGLEVHLFLETPAGPLPIGRTVSGEGGAYQADVEVPREAPLGDHRLLARVRGDEARRGSSSRGR